MKLSDKGLELLKGFEGLALEAYKDVAGIWTIGYGHAQAIPGQKITAEEAEEVLRRDVARFEQAVEEAASILVTQGQFDALVVFSFNVGIGALQRSTLLKKLNAGDSKGASDEFQRWVYAGGKKFRGLERRRMAEARLFRGDGVA